MKQRRFSEAAKAIGVKDTRILRALNELPRKLFVAPKYAGESRLDRPVSLGSNVTTSQPSLVGYMVELLELTVDKRVLEIGTGSGYQAAVMARLAQEVVTIERIGSLAKKARRVLAQLEFENVTVIEGDGRKGYPEKSPYQAIILAAASRSVPETLIEQLDERGVLLYPKQEAFGQVLMKGRKTKGVMKWEKDLKVAFVPLKSGIE